MSVIESSTPIAGMATGKPEGRTGHGNTTTHTAASKKERVKEGGAGTTPFPCRLPTLNFRYPGSAGVDEATPVRILMATGQVRSDPGMTNFGVGWGALLQ